MVAAAVDIAKRFELVEAIVREAGNIALDYYRKPRLLIESKGVQDLVTEADMEVEAFLVANIRAKFPDDAFLGEEGGVKGTIDRSVPLWVIDPIDGTANFARGVPVWAISVAMVLNGDVEIGFVYDAVAAELYSARKGAGAWRNGEDIRVSPVSDHRLARIHAGYSFRMTPDLHLTGLERLLAKECEYVRVGSCAIGMAHVADGRSEGYWEPHVNSWDVLGGWLLVKEAGGWVNSFLDDDGLMNGNWILASAPGVQGFLNEQLGDLHE